MSERYEIIFLSENNLYSKGSPVVLSAGALSKDNLNGKIILQLKVKNIASKKIKGAKIVIEQFDTIGKSLGDSKELEYLDILCSRNEEFGQKVPQYLEDNSVRSFEVKKIVVFFEDNSSWESDKLSWLKLPVAEKLDFNFYQRRAYNKKFSDACKYIPKKIEDIWICSCENINKEDKPCSICGNRYDELINYDKESLTYDAAIDMIAEEKYEAAVEAFNTIIDYSDSHEKIKYCEEQIEIITAENAEKERIKREKIKKFSKKAGIVAAIVFVLALIFNLGIKPPLRYKKAKSLAETGNYAEAIEKFEKLGKYKDSEDMLSKVAKADNFINSQNYKNILSALETFDEGADCKSECSYDYKSRTLNIHQKTANQLSCPIEELEPAALVASIVTFETLDDMMKTFKGKVDSDINILYDFYENKKMIYKSKNGIMESCWLGSAEDIKNQKDKMQELLYKKVSEYCNQKKYQEACDYYDLCKDRKEGYFSLEYEDLKDYYYYSQYKIRSENMSTLGEYLNAQSAINKVNNNFKDAKSTKKLFDKVPKVGTYRCDKHIYDIIISEDGETKIEGYSYYSYNNYYNADEWKMTADKPYTTFDYLTDDYKITYSNNKIVVKRTSTSSYIELTDLYSGTYKLVK